MKNFIISTVFFITIVTNAFTQNFVTEDKTYVKEQLVKSGIPFNEKKTTDGFDYFVFDDALMQIEYYFDNNSICHMYRIIFPCEALNEIQADLNMKFDYLGDMVWREFDTKTYFIWMILFYGDQCVVSVIAEDTLKK